MSDDNNELNEILEVTEEDGSEFEELKSFTEDAQDDIEDFFQNNSDDKNNLALTHCQFSQVMDNQFTPCGPTTNLLGPGVYKISRVHGVGLVFSKVSVKVENLIVFPDSNSEKIIKEISCFWDREKLFNNFGLPHKRGILLWGQPGSGKSSCVQLIMKDVIEREGVVFLFDHPIVFIEGYNSFRKIQPETPIVVIMEDLDEIIERWGENEVLQILDGVHKIHKTVFLASTNYPQRLKARVVNRPSRFDKRFKIGYPNKECRRIYLENIRKSNKVEVSIDLDKWVEDTEDFSFAHLKELFIATEILGDKYEDALETLKSMRKRAVSEEKDEFDKKKVGFNKGHIPDKY